MLEVLQKIEVIVNNFPIKIANRNFSFLMADTPANILIRNAGIKGSVMIITKFDNLIFLNFFIPFSIFVLVDDFRNL